MQKLTLAAAAALTLIAASEFADDADHALAEKLGTFVADSMQASAEQKTKLIGCFESNLTAVPADTKTQMAGAAKMENAMDALVNMTLAAWDAIKACAK